MRPRINLLSLPSRTTFVFSLIFILCLGIFLPALPGSLPAWGLLLTIVPMTVNFWLNGYERTRRRWRVRDLQQTHPRLAQHIHMLMREHAMRPAATRLELWCTADPRAMIHMQGTFRRYALVIWDRLADELQTAVTHPSDVGDATEADEIYVQMVLDQEVAQVGSIWQRYPLALLHSLTGRYRRARQAWQPQPLEATHPQLAHRLRKRIQPRHTTATLELWSTADPAVVTDSFHTLERTLVIVNHAMADALSQALERPSESVPVIFSPQRTDALLLHELAHLHQRDLTLVSLADALTAALSVTAGFYLFGNVVLALFLLRVPATLNILSDIGAGFAPALMETAGLAYDDNLYTLDWTIAGTAAHGIGLLEDDILAVGVGCSVAAYQVQPDGSLVGRWSGGQQFGHEQATPQAPALPGTLATTYTITGTNPEGDTYDGTLTLETRGAVYHLSWHIGEMRYTGVGLLQDATLAVGWGKQPTCGVIAYRVLPDGALSGQWGEYGNEQLRAVELVPAEGVTQ